MHYKDKVKFFVFFAFISLTVFSCRSLKTGNMTPEFSNVAYENTEKTIKISKITASEERIKGSEDLFFMKFIDEDVFKDALSSSLEQSGLFSRVLLNEGTADYAIESEIISQGQKIKVHDYNHNSITSAIIVKYRLIKLPDHSPLWEKKIASSGNADWSESFNSSVVSNRSMEKAVKKNMAFLLDELSQISEIFEGRN